MARSPQRIQCGAVAVAAASNCTLRPGSGNSSFIGSNNLTTVAAGLGAILMANGLLVNAETDLALSLSWPMIGRQIPNADYLAGRRFATLIRGSRWAFS